MRLRPALAAAVVAALLPLGALAQANDRVDGVVRVAQQAGADAAAQCRQAGLPDAQCARVPLAPAVSQQAIADYLRSDVHRTLAFQQALGDALPLRYASWIGTHNSFNTTTQPVTLSELDSNQQLSMTQQLDIDIRSLEVDAHWFPSVEGGGYGPVLCHGEDESEGHAGCTVERLLVDGLREINAWLAAHPHEVVLLYLEDHLVSDQGYSAAGRAVRSAFGSRLYAPGGAGCTTLPLGLTRNQVRAAGKQVVVMSSCHGGAGWNGAIYDDSVRAAHEEGPEGYGDNGTCDPRLTPAKVDGTFQRVYEDSTAVTANTSPPAHRISVGQASALIHCAVDLIGFDQITPSDARLAALQWTWAPSQPASGACAFQGSDGRWRTGTCSRKALACKGSQGWYVAQGSCRPGEAAVPRYGWEGVQLGAAMKRAGVASVELDLVRHGVSWSAG